MGLCSFPPPYMNVTAVAQGAVVPRVPAWGCFALPHREASLVLAHGDWYRAWEGEGSSQGTPRGAYLHPKAQGCWRSLQCLRASLVAVLFSPGGGFQPAALPCCLLTRGPLESQGVFGLAPVLHDQGRVPGPYQQHGAVEGSASENHF